MDETVLRRAQEHHKGEARLIQSTKEAAAELQLLFETDGRLNPGAK